jgi:hypothetical protein
MESPRPTRLSAWLLVPLALPFWTVVAWSNARLACRRAAQLAPPPVTAPCARSSPRWRIGPHSDQGPGDYPLLRPRPRPHGFVRDAFLRDGDPMMGLRF